jgi:hypothetical protein
MVEDTLLGQKLRNPHVKAAPWKAVVKEVRPCPLGHRRRHGNDLRVTFRLGDQDCAKAQV